MSDLKLKKITIRNWMKFVDAEVMFPDRGLVLVAGSNKASGGKLASVGAGKTAFGEAICRTLLGTRGRFTYAKSFSRDKKGDSYVKVEATHNGVPLIVENGYKCTELGGSGEALRYRYSEKPEVMRSKMEETRNEIAAILGVTPDLADWTVFIDGRKIEFDRLSQEDAVNLVMAAIMQPPWTQFFERSKKIVNTFDTTVANDASNHAAALRRLEHAKAQVAAADQAFHTEESVYKSQRKLNDERIAQLGQEKADKLKASETASTRQAALSSRIEQIENQKAEAHHKLEIERNDLDDKIRDDQEKKDAAVEKRSTANAALQTAKDKLGELQATPKDCPSCGKPWDKAHSEEEITKTQAKVTKAQDAYTKAAAKVTEITTAMAALQAKRRDVSTKLQNLNAAGEVNDLSNEYQRLENANKGRDQRVHAIDLEIVGLKKDVSDANVKAAKATLAERKTQVTKVEHEIEALAKTYAEDQESLKIVKYWNRAFGPTGIPNMVLSEALGPMNEVSRAISNRMTGGTIHVTYSTTKMLATGAGKAQLVINVDNEIGDSEIQGSSKGEGGLTNFIIAETLSEVGNVSSRIGFRWYDEIVPHQDPVVSRSIYAYMKEVANRLGILVFLVDHNPAAENYADHVLLIEKNKGDTSVSWR
jgi:DNA repair exonuclease SbcCD ATPase subunit